MAPETRTPAALVVSPQETPFDVATLASAKPDLVITSEMECGDRLRIHDRAAEAYWAYLCQNYSSDDQADLKYHRWTLLEAVALTGPPVDMLYTDPHAIVFHRR